MVNTLGDVQWSEGDAFTGMISRSYWSSTEEAPGSLAIWGVNMYDGRIVRFGKFHPLIHVWPFRSGN